MAISYTSSQQKEIRNNRFCKVASCKGCDLKGVCK